MEKVQPLQKNEYEISRFPFAKYLAEALSIDGCSLLDSTASNNTEFLEQAGANLGKLRENAMDAMHAEDFQKTLTEFSIHLAREHFAAPCYFQKTPSIRLFFPGMLGTSWHTDNWYGHHEKSRTFWLPLTKVNEGAGVHFIEDPDVLARLESGLGKSITLSSINNVCLVHAEEHTAQPGEYLNFSARTLHGSVENRSGSFRCSIDFRGSPLTAGVGNKPLSNYRIIEGNEAYEAVTPAVSKTAIKYISGVTGASTKYQHVLLEAYAAENEFNIIRNEAEIESVPERPVMLAYSKREVPQPDSYDHILVYSRECLPANSNQTQELLQHCAANGLNIHFALEDEIYPSNTSAITKESTMTEETGVA